MRSFSCLLVLLLSVASLHAAVEVVEFSDSEKERRYKSLINELRCLVCQNQNIAASNADLAKDLRQQVYQRIQRGETNQQIIEFMVARYGDFVLYKPPVKSKTLLLWFGPFVLLVVGIGAMVFFIRSRSKRVEPPVDTESLERVRRLLNDTDEPS